MHPQRRQSAARLAMATAAAVLLLGTTAGCTSSAQPASPSSGSSPAAAASGTSASVQPLTIDITLTGTKVQPNGEKIDARVGQQVVLHVTSDHDDEVHAHTGGDGHEFEVSANQPTTGSFTLTDPGSFEVESHHTGKVIVILNTR